VGPGIIIPVGPGIIIPVGPGIIIEGNNRTRIGGRMSQAPYAARTRARESTGRARPVAPPWLARRLWPLLATVGLVAFGMLSTTWWGPSLLGRPGWSLPEDLWGTLVAAERLLHGNLAGLYTPPTRLVTFPGAAVILLPLVAVTGAAGFSLLPQSAHNLHPAVWLVAGPYEIALSAVALFAADALAERMGVDRVKRAVLAGASAVALWSVAVRWGHLEDAVAVGLLLYAILALAEARTTRAAWLTGAAIAIQPLVLLALPVVLVLIEPRRLPGFLARAAAPAVVLLGAAAAANRTATFHAVTSQPNWATVNQATPWAYLAPYAGPQHAVAAGPFRILAILVACGCAVAAGRRWAAARGSPGWSPDTLAEVLWWTALALALRSVFEPVMVAYYLWPPLAVALIAASRDLSRLIRTSIAATAVTLISQVSWRGPWTWWAPMIAGLGLTLFFARAPAGTPQAAADPVEE
jgi:hypothetical protein